MTRDDSLVVAGVDPSTCAEGPHRRFALWLQGCTLACPGCCNPELFDADAGRRRQVSELLTEINAAPGGVEGVTVVGGEPLQQLPALTRLLAGVAASGLGVLVFTGYEPDEARALPGFDALWQCCDTLVAGRFDARRRDGAPAFVGSRNQTLLHRTTRYAADALWQGPPLAELVVEPDGRVRLVGAPSTGLVLARALARPRALRLADA